MTLVINNFEFKLAHVEDSKLYPGGKNYQTTINNEMKQIFSYIPREARKYQEMVQQWANMQNYAQVYTIFGAFQFLTS